MIEVKSCQHFELPDDEHEVRVKFKVSDISQDLENKLKEKLINECFDKIKRSMDPNREFAQRSCAFDRIYKDATQEMASRLAAEKYQEVIGQIDLRALINATFLKTVAKMHEAAT